MTITQLYDLYRAVYVDYDRVHGSLLIPGLSPLARAVAEFAVFDAQNGTPLRSRAAFGRALAHGADALGPLGLRAA